MTTSIAQHDTAELAERYDRISESQFENGKKLIEALGIRQGDHVLDLGCGTGRLLEYVAVLVGKTGKAAGIDPAEHRIAIAKQRTRGFGHVELRIGSDHDLRDLPENSFDVVYINSVFHHIEGKDAKEAALLNIHRILKKGGRLGISDPDESSPSILRTVTREVLLSYSVPLEEEESLSPDDLKYLVKTTGFEIKTLDQISHTRYHETPWKVIESSEASHFGNYLSEVPEDLRDKVKAEIEEKLRSYQTGDGIHLTRTRLFLIAGKDSHIP
jgi:ubiquinone/menaquinone biosynthesis C-methylase UbiE